MRVLVVEDDTFLLDGLTTGLSLHGIAADGVGTCEDASAALATTRFGAVVLDLMLPDGLGTDLLHAMRQRQDPTPVLLLTARDSPQERVLGLDAGADDYLGKPFDLDELAARLRALNRRAVGRSMPRLTWKGLMLDPGSFEASVDGVPVLLSRREFAILSALMERPGVVCSRGQLEERLYGWQEDLGSNAVEVHMHNLRAKIGRHHIQTLRGIGYRLRLEEP